jgi:hypothetical protein
MSNAKPGMLMYIAAPYTAKNEDGSENKEIIDQRMRIVSCIMAMLANVGTNPVSPLLLHYARTEDNKLPGTWEFWKDYSIALLSKCSTLSVICLQGWDTSTGVKEEIDTAIKMGKMITYIDPQSTVTGKLQRMPPELFEKDNYEQPTRDSP